MALLDTAVISSPRLGELSGIAASRHPGVFWTHNDSGDEPALYAIDSAGRDRGSRRVAGAVNRDWEDMAAGPCVVAPGRCLYLADIGDNSGRRTSVVVYRAPEPTAPLAGDTVLELLDSIVLRYPDRPHNAEALAITADGLLLLTTKDLRGPARVFVAPAGSHESVLQSRCDLAMRVEPFAGRIVTGMAVSPDDRLLVVRTYVSLHLFRNDGACSPLTGLGGVAVPVVEAQGEAVTFEAPDRLVLVSERGEGGHAILTRLRLLGLP